MSDVDILLRQALGARREERLEDARRDLAEAVRLCRERNGRQDLARALAASGQIERDLNQPEAAVLFYEEAAELYRMQGEVGKLAHTIRHVADIHCDAGRPEAAEPLYDEALRLYRGDSRTRDLDLANAIRGLATLKQDAGDAAAAKMLWTEAKHLYAAAHVDQGVAESERRLSLLSA